MPILIFIAVLAVLVLSHEFGHFIVAKKSGIRVDEFGFGFPPRLFKFKKGETIYSVNAIPFGGFVKIHGEDGQSANDKKSFASKPAYTRALVLAAGVFFNFLLAWSLFSFCYMIGLPSSSGSIPFSGKISDINITVVNIASDSPAEGAGLIAGDVILGFDKIEEFQNFISANAGKEIELKYNRHGQEYSAKIIPRENPPLGEGALGLVMDEIGIVRLSSPAAFWEGAKITAQLAYGVAIGIFNFAADVFKGLAGLESVVGPVGLVNVASSAADLGLAYFLSFVAFLSINLGVINILPIPALDGGRLVFLLAEKIKGSPVSPKYSSIIHGVSFALLLILMLAITVKDIRQLI